MEAVRLHDKQQIAEYLEGDPYLHIYGLGDLDDFFWPYTSWYGLSSGGTLSAVVLLYAGPALPTLIALSQDHEPMRELLASIIAVLPPAFYAHLSPGLEIVFEDSHSFESGADHLKMALRDVSYIQDARSSAVVRLGKTDLAPLTTLYERSYPGNWFDPRMLETGQYFGLREGQRLLSAAGVHVFSPEYRVAALGNITTLPEFRRRGYGTLVTATLCRSLLDQGLRIGLNVQADNLAAVSSYTQIGFEVAAEYREFLIRLKESP